MKNKHYDILKWVAIIVIPALAVLVGQVGNAFNWEFTKVSVEIINAVALFLGTILGVSNYNYKKENANG